jgi:glycosyltransferase involved in cell wall biosynthesis
MTPSRVAASPTTQRESSRLDAHIALLMGSFNGRGVQRVFLNLGAELVRRGHRVSLLVCRSRGALQGETLEGMDLFTLRPAVPLDWRTARAMVPLLRYCLGTSAPPFLTRLEALRQFIDTERPDVVISGGTRCNLLNSLTRRVCGARYQAIVTEHNPISGKVRRASRQWKLRGLIELYPYADAVAGVSAGVSEELAGYLGTPSLPVLPNPVVTPRLLAESRLPPDHPWLNDGGPPVVLAVGALESRKNFAMLLRALASLRRRRPARLIVLGEGPQRVALEALARDLGIEDAVALPGFTTSVAPYLASASALALSSTYEGFGCVLVEAMACGCPVVSTDCPYGPREILAGGRYGRLVEPDDAAALARALEQTLDEPVDRAMLATRADDFSVSRAADAYLALMFPSLGRDSASARSKISS